MNEPPEYDDPWAGPSRPECADRLSLIKSVAGHAQPTDDAATLWRAIDRIKLAADGATLAEVTELTT